MKEGLLISSNAEEDRKPVPLSSSVDKPLEQQPAFHDADDSDMNTAYPDSHYQFEILLVGLAVAFMVFMPNIMLSDPGDDRAETKAALGMWACLLFLVGGIVGCLRHTWWALAPAVVCQIVALAY